MMDTKSLLNLAISVTHKVGKFLLENTNSQKTFFHKHDSHYSIEQDLQTHFIYEKMLGKHTPDIYLHSEEGLQGFGDNLSWVVDPIEGTTNYASKVPIYATQIALIKRSQVILSVVHAPLQQETYTASIDQPTKLNNNTVSVSNLSNLSDATLTLGAGTYKKAKKNYTAMTQQILSKARSIRHFGCTGLELAYTAAGRLHGHIDSGSQPYDYLPGTFLVERAGGVVVNQNGKTVKPGDKYLIASNSSLAKQILSCLETLV